MTRTTRVVNRRSRSSVGLEHSTFNGGVVGSSPTGITKFKKMKQKTNNTIEEKITFIAEFCERMNIPLTINRNPNPKEIERIRGAIKRSEDITNQIQKN